MTEVNLFNIYYQFLSPLNTGYVQAIKIILKEDVVIIFMFVRCLIILPRS